MYLTIGNRNTESESAQGQTLRALALSLYAIGSRWALIRSQAAATYTIINYFIIFCWLLILLKYQKFQFAANMKYSRNIFERIAKDSRPRNRTPEATNEPMGMQVPSRGRWSGGHSQRPRTQWEPRVHTTEDLRHASPRSATATDGT